MFSVSILNQYNEIIEKEDIMFFNIPLGRLQINRLLDNGLLTLRRNRSLEDNLNKNKGYFGINLIERKGVRNYPPRAVLITGDVDIYYENDGSQSINTKNANVFVDDEIEKFYTGILPDYLKLSYKCASCKFFSFRSASKGYCSIGKRKTDPLFCCGKFERRI